jgi:hypothetical protein
MNDDGDESALSDRQLVVVYLKMTMIINRSRGVFMCTILFLNDHYFSSRPFAARSSFASNPLTPIHSVSSSILQPASIITSDSRSIKAYDRGGEETKDEI